MFYIKIGYFCLSPGKPAGTFKNSYFNSEFLNRNGKGLSEYRKLAWILKIVCLFKTSVFFFLAAKVTHS